MTIIFLYMGIFVWPRVYSNLRWGLLFEPSYILVWARKFCLTAAYNVALAKDFCLTPCTLFGRIFVCPTIFWIWQNSSFSGGVNRKSASQNSSFSSVCGGGQKNMSQNPSYSSVGVNQKKKSQNSSFSSGVNQKILCQNARLENSKW